MLQCFQSHSLSFFSPQFLCSSHTDPCMYQSNTNKSVELRADHSTSSAACLKPAARANSNLTKNCKEVLCDALCGWKTHKMGLQRFGGVLTTPADTHSKCVWGRSQVGRTRQKECCRSRGAWERPRAQLVWPYARVLPRLVGAVTSHVTWSHIQILTLSAALLFSQVLATLQELSPSPRQKILRRHDFVLPSIYAFHGRTGLSTA